MFENPMETPQVSTQCEASVDARILKRKPRAIFWGAFVVAGLVALIMGIWILNYLIPDRPLQRVIASDSRNASVKASAHWEHWTNSNTLVFNVTGVAGASRLDVFRVFLQYANEVKDKHYSRVVLAANGANKFEIDGAYFRELGEEFNFQNPMYTVRTFPAHVTTMSGEHPFHEYEGGFLGVLTAEMKQFTEFSDEWYSDN